MLGYIKRYRTLSWADRVLLLRAFLGLATVDVSLRIFGFRRLLAEARPAAAPGPLGAEALQHAKRYARWLESASRHHLVHARCLHRSLTLHLWLRQEGMPSELRIGVRKETGELKAHAWVELDGQVLGEERAAIAKFQPLFSSGSLRALTSSTTSDRFASQFIRSNNRSVQWQ